MATKIDIEGMRSAIARANDAHQQMVSLLSRVNSTVAESSAVWKGSAQAAFMSVTSDYSDAATKMNSSMGQMIDMLNHNMKQYSSQEEQAVDTITATRSSLNLG